MGAVHKRLGDMVMKLPRLMVSRADDGDFGMFREEVHGILETMWKAQVISIVNGYIVAGCQRNPFIERTGPSQAPFADVSEPVIMKRPADSVSLIVRSIVHDHDFEA
jgi:hypothetical protein